MEMIFSQLLALDQISDRATYDARIPSLLGNIGQITRSDRAYIFSIHEEEECYYRNDYEWCQDGVTPQIENLQHVPAALIPLWDHALRGEKPSASGIWKRSRMLCPQSMTSCMRRASTASPCFLSLPPGNSSDSSALTILTTPFMTSLPKYCRSSAAIGAASARISMPRKRCAKAAPGSNLSSSPSGARPIWSMSSPRTTAASSAAISRRIPSRRSRESPAVRRILPASSASGSQSL